MTFTSPEPPKDDSEFGCPVPPPCEYEGCSNYSCDRISGKFLCSDHCSPKGMQVVTVEGRKFFAVNVDFDAPPENWMDYKLCDGTRRVLRVRHIVKRVQRIVGLEGPDGSDTYTFQSEVVSDVQDAAPTLDLDPLKTILGTSTSSKERSRR